MPQNLIDQGEATLLGIVIVVVVGVSGNTTDMILNLILCLSSVIFQTVLKFDRRVGHLQ